MTDIDHNQVLAEAAARHLRETGAINYTGAVFIINFDGGDQQIEVLVTTQKVGALTPHDLRVKAEERTDLLEGLLLRTNELLYAIQGDPGAVPSSSIDSMRGRVFEALKRDRSTSVLHPQNL